MDRNDLIARLKAIEAQIRARGVAALYLYGSYARDEACADSDIDIFVDFDTGRGAGLEAFLAPYELLGAQFPGAEIGYGTRDALAPHYRPHIERSAIRIF